MYLLLITNIVLGRTEPIFTMKKLVCSALIFGAISLTSCATVFCDSKAKVTFDSNVDATADLTIDGRKHNNVSFPYTTKIKRGFDDTIVKAEVEGYKPTMLYIDKTFNAVSVINLCDVLGWAIDAATGAITKPEFKFYEIEFEKDSAE